MIVPLDQVLLLVSSASDPGSAAVTSATEIAKSGVLGAVFIFVTVPLALYARHLSKQLADANNKWAAAEKQRASDAQQVVDKLLQLNDKWNSTLSEQTHVVAALESTLKDNKDALMDVRDLLMERRRPQ